MAKYKPGTIDDEDAVRRRLQSIERKADEANRPSGSNAYGTTGKLQNFESVNLPVASVGMIVFSTSPTLPHEAGSPGIWKLKTRAFIPMTDDTLYYVYERIE